MKTHEKVILGSATAWTIFWIVMALLSLNAHSQSVYIQNMDARQTFISSIIAYSKFDLNCGADDSDCFRQRQQMIKWVADKANKYLAVSNDPANDQLKRIARAWIEYCRANEEYLQADEAASKNIPEPTYSQLLRVRIALDKLGNATTHLAQELEAFKLIQF